MSYLIRNLGPVDTYPNIYEDGVFFSVLTFCPPVNSVFRHPKPRFSKTAPRVELFSESPAYRLCEQTRTEFFEYNDVIHHTAHALLMMLSYFFVFLFFENGHKRISVLKNIRILVEEDLVDLVIKHLLWHKIAKVNLCDVLYHSLALTSAKLWPNDKTFTAIYLHSWWVVLGLKSDNVNWHSRILSVCKFSFYVSMMVFWE